MLRKHIKHHGLFFNMIRVMSNTDYVLTDYVLRSRATMLTSDGMEHVLS